MVGHLIKEQQALTWKDMHLCVLEVPRLPGSQMLGVAVSSEWNERGLLLMFRLETISGPGHDTKLPPKGVLIAVALPG